MSVTVHLGALDSVCQEFRAGVAYSVHFASFSMLTSAFAITDSGITETRSFARTNSSRMSAFLAGHSIQVSSQCSLPVGIETCGKCILLNQVWWHPPRRCYSFNNSTNLTRSDIDWRTTNRRTPIQSEIIWIKIWYFPFPNHWSAVLCHVSS